MNDVPNLKKGLKNATLLWNTLAENDAEISDGIVSALILATHDFIQSEVSYEDAVEIFHSMWKWIWSLEEARKKMDVE